MGISNQAPSSFFAGDTVQWVEKPAAYALADGWTLQADLVSVSKHVSATSTDDGSGNHLLAFSSANTADLDAGAYKLVIAAIKGAERFSLGTDNIEVKPDPTSAGDHRSNVKKTLDAISDYLLNSNNLSAASYSIAGRTVGRHSMIELLALRKQLTKEYQLEISRERLASGRSPRRRLLTRMRG